MPYVQIVYERLVLPGAPAYRQFIDATLPTYVVPRVARHNKSCPSPTIRIAWPSLRPRATRLGFRIRRVPIANNVGCLLALVFTRTNVCNLPALGTNGQQHSSSTGD